jgi:AsmA protein
VMPGPLNLDGALDSAGRAYAIRNAAVTLGQLRAGGEVVADLRGARPKLQLNLEAETLWLDALLPSSGSAPGSWGSAVLPAGLLRAIDAEVSILARNAVFRGFTAGASRVTATLLDGRLESAGALRLQGSGTASFTATADAVVLPPAGTLSLKAENADLEGLITALTGVTALGGTGNLTLDLAAEGRTQEELAGTLKGSASLALAQGRLAGADLGGMPGVLRERILDGWNAVPGGTPLDSLTASAEIADGLATITAAEVKSGALQLRLSGTADLLKRSVDLKAEFQPPETAPLPVPVIVRGNWSAPRIYPDIPDILNNPEGGFARLRATTTPPGN